jgi:hypothetical protein
MSALRQLSRSVRSNQPKSKMVFDEDSKEKFVQPGQNGTYANIEPEMSGGGRKNVFTRAHLPPAAKKALKSSGKAGVHSGAVVGSEGLGMLEDSSKIVRKHGAKIIAAKALNAMSGAGLPIKRKYVKKVKKVVEDAVADIPEDVKGAVKSRAKKVVKEVKGKVKEELVGAGAKRPPSKWILHVKAYAKDHNVSYKEAMSAARPSYKK